MHVAVGLLLVAVGLMRAVVDLEASEAGTTDLLVLNICQGLFRKHHPQPHGHQLQLQPRLEHQHHLRIIQHL